jgi:uncharacterized protein YndB with AHSA1/START domain
MTTREFVYVTYIEATADQVWSALTDAELTAQFWGHSNVSDWTESAEWRHVRTDGSGIADVTGRVVASDRPELLSLTFGEPEDADSPTPTATFTIEQFQNIVKLTITHNHLPADQYDIAALGWASVAANLKTLLETGHTLPQAPWEMHAELAPDLPE